MSALRVRIEVAALQALLTGLGMLMALASRRVDRFRRQVTRDLLLEISSADGARQQYRLHAATRRLTLPRHPVQRAECTLTFPTARVGLRILISRRAIGRLVEDMNFGGTRIDGNPALMLWSGDANLAKFAAPTVEGVDYPSVGLSVARNDTEHGELLIQTYAATPSHAGRATSVRVVQLPDIEAVRATCDGEEFTAWRTAGPDAIELDLTIGDHALVVSTGYHGRRADVPHQPAKHVVPTPAAPNPAAIAAAARSCRCC